MSFKFSDAPKVRKKFQIFGKNKKNEIILNKKTKTVDLIKVRNNFSLSSFDRLDLKKSKKCQNIYGTNKIIDIIKAE